MGIYDGIKKMGCPILHAIYLHLCVCVAVVKRWFAGRTSFQLRSASITHVSFRKCHRLYDADEPVASLTRPTGQPEVGTALPPRMCVSQSGHQENNKGGRGTKLLYPRCFTQLCHRLLMEMTVTSSWLLDHAAASRTSGDLQSSDLFKFLNVRNTKQLTNASKKEEAGHAFWGTHKEKTEHYNKRENVKIVAPLFLSVKKYTMRLIWGKSHCTENANFQNHRKINYWVLFLLRRTVKFKTSAVSSFFIQLLPSLVVNKWVQHRERLQGATVWKPGPLSSFVGFIESAESIFPHRPPIETVDRTPKTANTVNYYFSY